MGLRLPLDSIPWVAEKDYPWVQGQDPSQKFAELPKDYPRSILIDDALDGQPRLFARQDAVEESWRIVDEVAARSKFAEAVNRRAGRLAAGSPAAPGQPGSLTLRFMSHLMKAILVSVSNLSNTSIR